MKKRHLPLYLGLAILLLFAAVALVPSFFTSYSRKDMFPPWLGMSSDHLLGTNYLGYDIYTELIYGTRDTLVIGVASSILSLVLGLAIGTLSSADNFVGSIFTSLTNIFVYLPRLVTLIVLSTFLGSSSFTLIVLISAFSWVGTSRVVKGKIVHLSSAPFIENCTLLGYSKLHTVLHHYVRNLQDVIISRFLAGATSCIMMESTLSFLGFGDLYHPTWGTMVNYAWKRGAMLRHAYNYLLAPGFAIMALSLSFFFLSLFFEKKQEEIKL
mgnify:FL=1